ncbi:MFS multidrug transporter, putative [Talaromyces stipitatus ATCC 10500]|uniref:MFS multidrug transporter, putative n=1 Tax=Talaromyces stipitatus (strain ATCC 10500 / CBS 375.48 / QM 6759 / NRRL 1006) TaxID=441959 RepID=B8MBB4_TALSN|nr:MFS multidrug transporter, putative [Talaromyces stipitatus ATCC 10500]EED18903.1 MFS multidrug transporter, putative [Talaromyces stipitatus ATCC 10500]
MSAPVSEGGEKLAFGKEGQPSKSQDQTDIIYPRGLKLALLIMSIFVGMFLVSLDRLIVSTAIPQITNEFKSAGDIGWYGTAYLLTNCAFQLLFGKVYTFFNVKATFLTSIILFEVGSALCGAAPNSVAFILGRAIAGLGAGGILSGVIVVIVYAIPLHKRPKYQGFFGAVFAVASVAGPLIGGAFTTDVTWRWCFYINLPLGGVVMVFIFFLLQVPDRPTANIPLKEKLHQLNVLGMIALVPGVVCLCLALQWGGTTCAWSEGRIVALLVVAFALLIAFALIQVWKPEQATLPPRVFLQRSIASGFWVSLCLGAHMNLLVYYLPIYFQAIDGASAVNSGIRLLPMVIPIVVASILTGQFVSYIGYYTPFMIFGVCLTAVGAGLLTTLEINTTTGKWIGYQIIYGFGLGCSNQTPNMAAQTVLPRDQVAIGASLMFFGQTLFGAIFTSVGQNVLENQLIKRFLDIPGITAKLIQSTGATDILKFIPADRHTEALVKYNDSIRVCFQVGLIVACLSIIGAVFMEWRTVKKDLKKPDSEAGKGQAESTDNKTMEANQEKKENLTEADVEIKQENEKDKETASATSTEATRTASHEGHTKVTLERKDHIEN